MAHTDFLMHPRRAPLSTEANLVARARAGQPDALGELFERFAEPTWDVLVRLLASPADADDVLQDVFVGLPEALASYTARGSLGGWIRQVAVRTALMRLRGKRRRAEQALDEAGAPEYRGDQVVLRLALEQALSELPEEFRMVFVLKEVAGYSHAEIADALAISVTLSEQRLHRARLRLRSMLEDPT